MPKTTDKMMELDSRLILQIRRRLLAWYGQAARDLPWRRTRDPYAVWVSEIMLQQTQVDTVIPYYRRFLKAFPDVQALARAPEDNVLKLWEGLGYYRRARNLQAAAQWVVRENQGRFPQSAEAWQALPGIGPYTAGAIASIAFGEPAPILDGNVKRVWARLFAISGSLEASTPLKTLWHLSGRLVPEKQAGDFNQSVMELGALVCLPKGPVCGSCPLSPLCRAYASGHPEQWPEARSAGPKPHRHMVAGVLRERGAVLIGKRPAGGLLGGLWEFPGGEAREGETWTQALERSFQAETGLRIRTESVLVEVKHAFTHFTMTLHAFRVRRIGGRLHPRHYQALRWSAPGLLQRHAFSRAHGRILSKYLEQKSG